MSHLPPHPPQSQGSYGNHSFNNQARKSSNNPFSSNNGMNSDDDLMEPPSLSKSHSSHAKPPRSAGLGGMSGNREMSNNSAHGGISRWFSRSGSTPDSSQHGLGRSQSPARSGEDLANAVSHRLGEKPSRSSISDTLDPAEVKKKKKKKKKTVKSKSRMPKIQQWPYDDFHKQEIKHYSKMGDTDSSQDFSLQSQNNEQQQQQQTSYFFKGRSSQQTNTNNHNTNTAISHLYERPPELPSIKEAVKDLPLLEFEKVASQRALHIVSTFLFDSGLIDELLVNGGMTYKKPSLPTLAPRSDSSIHQNGNASVGVEVGMNGFPIGENSGSGLKVDKEINRLRINTQRQLSKINHRLNDGVATSGAEVQKLVNAVAETKGDLGRLKELLTYTNIQQQNDFILANYPKLKTAMNARRNLFRCFRELEFFSQIPITCERLREEMHSGEWTKDEWAAIRNVCMQHVELQTLLIEAELGMKARIKIEASENGGTDSKNFLTSHEVDKFLSSHVKNVWELGEELRNRVLSGIGNAFEISMNNPAGMVALCEAVEVYEKAEEQLKSDKKNGSERLHFTNIRADALSKIYEDFETKGVSVFRDVHAETDAVNENDAMNVQFSSILRGATELVAEIDLVKHQMSPCFPPHWSVEVLWSSCVSHVCSNQILQQIGGPTGNYLCKLSVTQLLDLIAWIEFFRIHIDEAFPNIAVMKSTQKTYFDERPDLFALNKKEVDLASATDSVAWANNMLWEVHRLAQEEFLMRTRLQTLEFLGNVYAAQHEEHQTADGKLASSLCEDLFSLVGVQIRTIKEHLSPTSDALVLAVCLVFSHLNKKQIESRDNYLNDLESCCAYANDFSRMSEKCEDVTSELLNQTELAEESVETLEASSSELIALYSSDAVFAAQSTYVYIFEPIYEQIAEQFFTEEWENNFTGNELAHMLVKTLEDYMGDLERYLSEFLARKTVESLVTATVTFYIKSLLMHADKHKSNRDPAFSDVSTALERFKGDANVLRKYFENFIKRNPPLARTIKNEFEMLTTVQEIMYIASGLNEGDPGNFVIIVHKKMRNIDTTKHLFGDLWHLVNPGEERTVWTLIEKMEEDLNVIAPQASRFEPDRNEIPGLKLVSMLKSLYETTQRKLPNKAGWFD